MEITLLGAGTLLPDDRKRSAAHLVEADATKLLLDCGSGSLHGFARYGLDWRGLTHLAISHFHTDHFGDLAPLLWALVHGVPGGREAELTILGPAGLAGRVEALARAHGDYLLDPGFPVRIVELDGRAEWRDPEGGLEIRTHPTPHTEESLAWRVELSGAAMGYTGDTGPHPPLGGFFAGVRALVSECSLADPPELTNHLSPRSVARLAVAADPEVLLLTHLYPEVDPDTLPDLIRAEGYTGLVHAGRDGLAVRLIDGREPEIFQRPSTGNG